MDRWTGRLLGGRFQLLRLLGRGSSSSVYEAENVTISRRVAIKILEPRARLIEDTARRFVREAKALARASHPNVVSVIDIEEDRITSALFIVQELLEGEDLRALLRTRGSLSVEETLSVVLPIGDALEAAHAAGVVHRDVRPSNIFLARVGSDVVPKLIDFGRARRSGVDPRVDVALLGAVVQRCVGRRAPADLEDLVQRMTSEHRRDRITTMSEALRALRGRTSMLPLRATG